MAAGTAARDVVVGVRMAPVITADVRAELAAERRKLAANPEQAFAADLESDAKYLYRTQPGAFRRIVHVLPMAPEEAAAGDEKVFNFRLRRWKQLVAQQWYPDLPREEAAAKLTALLEEVRDALGDTKLVFTRVPRRTECYFETNSDVVAAYLDRLIERKVGDFAQVYKQSKARVIVGDKAFPNTESGWRLARKYAGEQGIEEIKLVKE